ncbi:MAG TPA: alpha/beta fold hydrolase [Terriglobales bacterium]
MTRSKRRWLRWFTAIVVLLILLTAAVGFTYEAIGRRRDSCHPFRVGTAVDIGGRSLNIDCAGTGSPAVILEAGGGGRGGYGWREVQSGVATFTTVCWYDRAGEGWSDPPTSPRSSATVVQDLHELLQRTPVPGPYVLVGHSIGGEYVRIYASKFPAEVAGLVLVDSTHPDQREPAALLSPVSRLPVLLRRLSCSALPIAARFGIIRFALHNASVHAPPEFNSEQGVAERAMRNQRVKGAETEATQGCAASDGGAILPDRGSGNPEIDGAARSSGGLGDRPLIVLVAGQYWKSDDPVAAQQLAEFHETWVHQLQPELARLSSKGKLVVVANSDHGIPAQAPESVVNAVYEIVTDLRQKQSP